MIEATNKAFISAEKRNLISQINNEIKKQPSNRQWQGVSFFALDSKPYDALIATHNTILCVDLIEANGRISPLPPSNYMWRMGSHQHPIFSPLLESGKKANALSKKLATGLKLNTNVKVINLVVIIGNADLSDVNCLDFGNRVLLFKDFLNLINNSLEFNSLTRPRPNTKLLPNEVQSLFKFIEQNSVVNTQIMEEYNAIEPIVQHRYKAYQLYMGESALTDEDVLVKQWDFSHIAQISNTDRTQILSREQLTLNYIKIHHPKIYSRCLESSIDLNNHSQSFYDQTVELPDTKHQLLNDYLTSNSNGAIESKIDLVRSLFYVVSELHKIDVTHGDLNQFTIILDQDKKVKLTQFQCASFGDNYLDSRITDLLSLFHPIKVNVDHEITAFQRDVYWLGYWMWTIFKGKAISIKNIRDYNNLVQTEDWLDNLAYHAANFKFENATALLKAFLMNYPKASAEYYISADVLHPYVKDIGLANFDQDSYHLISKSISDDMTSHEILFYKTQLEKWTVLRAQHYNDESYIPEITDFGISQHDDQKVLYMVTPKHHDTEDVRFFSWKELLGEDGTYPASIEYDKKIHLAIHLIKSLQHYHHLHYSYGELSEDTINLRVKCINGVDYGTVILHKVLDVDNDELSFDEVYDHTGQLLNTPQQLDNYQALQLLYRFFATELTSHFWLKSAFDEEFKEQAAPYLNLSRFLTQLECKGQSKEETTALSVVKPPYSDLVQPLTILPDNGKLYVSFKRNYKGDIDATLWGLGGKLVLACNSNEPKNVKYLSHEAAIPLGFKTNATLELNISIESQEANPSYLHIIRQNYIPKLTDLLDFLNQHKEFLQKLQSFATSSNSCTLNAKQSIDNIEENYSLTDMSTAQKWALIKDTEQQSLPMLEIQTDAKPIKSQFFNDYVKFRYEAINTDTQILGQFDKQDQVNALLIHERQKDSFETKKVGEVDIVKSTNEVLYLKNSKIGQLKQGGRIILQSQADLSSYKNRKNALNTILHKESVLPNLIDYLEKDADICPTQYKVPDFNPQIYNLNDSQSAALQLTLGYGPVSIIQGPPGTGKTEFISSIVHVQFQTKLVKNVLVVSQSHESVNNTVERIRNRFIQQGEDISILRISNKAEHVSNQLLDTYSGAIIDKQREFYKESLAYRIHLMGASFGIPEDYLNELIKFKAGIFNEIKQIRNLHENIEDGALSEKEFKLFISNQFAKLQQEFDISAENADLNNTEFCDLLEKSILDGLQAEFEIDENTAIKAVALIDIAQDCELLIDTPHAYYERFLAQTRQVVCGTCVGIANHRIDISNQVFDLVIIDEAARSSSSELAIAMQSGKRILLVGDHKQLPPLYSTDHSDLLKKKLNLNSHTEVDEFLKSDFETLFNSPYGQQVKGELLQQYRMNPSIGNIVSSCFYDEKLQSFVYEQPFDEKNERMRAVPTFYQNSIIPEIKCDVTWVDTSHSFHQKDKDEATSLYNTGEIQAILSVLTKINQDKTLIIHLENLAKSGDAPIGIICAYAEQKRRLRRAFYEQGFSTKFTQLVKIDTVDSYQGKQNRIIMFSVTRNAKDFSSAFLKSINRVNVALSRAMDRLIIFGATRMWEHPRNAEAPLAKTLAYLKSHINKDHGLRYQIIRDSATLQSKKTKRKGEHS
jgi:tRNA A-37 threonylcarbamoyl transferase component Bud32